MGSYYKEGYVKPIDILDVMGVVEEEIPVKVSTTPKSTKGMPVEQWTVGFGKMIARYRSVTYAAQVIGVSRHNIYGVLAGNRNTAGGYCWRYEHQEEV